MADKNQITYTDLVKPTESITNAIKQLEDLDKVYTKQLDKVQKSAAAVEKEVKGLSGATNDQREALKKNAKAVDGLSKEHKQLLADQKEAKRLENQLVSARAKNVQALSANNKELVKQKERLKETNKQLREQAKASLGIKKSNGLFKSMTKSILAASGAMIGLSAAFRVLKNAGKLVRDFQKENAVLAGVLNTTREGVSELTKDAERLGSTTAKTAQDVTSLQIAYARLGFTQEEILNLTGDTIDGSIALNAELSETAELTGAMVRSFDELSTTDADLVLDQLTLSTQKTALNFQKLQTALPVVAGAASAAGVSFSTVVAQLGQAADRGIDASTAATSLRNIYIELSKKGITLDNALKQINESQDKLTTATDLFGKRAAVTALSLAGTIDKTQELEIALADAGGTAKSVADEQLATLDGSIQLLTSAWQGFILSIENGDGVIAKFVNGTLKTFADALTELTNLDLIFTRTSKLTQEQIERTYDALNALSNKTGKNFQKFVDEYDDVSSQWLAINKNTAIELLNDLGFSNKEAELLYTEHLRRLVEQEKTAAIAAIQESKRVEEEKTKIVKEEHKERENNDVEAFRDELARRKAHSAALLKLVKDQFNKRFGEQFKQQEAEKGQLTKGLLDRNKAAMEAMESSEISYDFYERLGIVMNSEQKAALSASVNAVVGAIQEVLAAQLAAADRAVDASNERVSSAENALDREIELRNQGYASNVRAAQRELALEKKSQDAALAQQAKAQKTKAAIDTLSQTSSLITAAAQLWASYSVAGLISAPLAIGAIAAMFGSFAFAKIKSNQLSKQEFAEGDYSVLDGGSHASGNDIFIGEQGGKAQYAEGGEGRAIINKRNTRKYRNILPDVINSLNKGTFENKYMKSFDGGMSFNMTSNAANLKNLESGVDAIRKQGERSYYTDSKGRMVMQYKNLKRTYNAN